MSHETHWAMGKRERGRREGEERVRDVWEEEGKRLKWDGG